MMIALIAGALCLGTAASAGADDAEQSTNYERSGPEDGEVEMPQFGPPKEMEKLEAINGTYAVKFSYKTDPASEEWSETDATAELSTVAGGGAQQLRFEGEMMGMPLSGVGLTSYDRETERWQTVWVDSMGARISVYTGNFEDGVMVVTGEDLNQGMTFQSRLTTYNLTEEGFDWKYELSMDGTTFVETAKATYRKQ